MSNRQMLPEVSLNQNRHFIPYFYSFREDVNIALPFLWTTNGREAVAKKLNTD